MRPLFREDPIEIRLSLNTLVREDPIKVRLSLNFANEALLGRTQPNSGCLLESLFRVDPTKELSPNAADEVLLGMT